MSVPLREKAGISLGIGDLVSPKRWRGRRSAKEERGRQALQGGLIPTEALQHVIPLWSDARPCVREMFNRMERIDKA